MAYFRKFKTIQQDRLRGLPACYLANFLQDFFHNLKKTQEQVKQFQKMEGVSKITRNLLTKRVQLKIVNEDEDVSIGKEAKRLSNF